QDQLEFLRTLIITPSPSGFEEQVQELFLRRVKNCVDASYKDVHGNAFGVINSSLTPRVMLAGHCDEIGFMVEYVNEQGYIYFSTVGGVDPHITPGSRVVIHTLDGPIAGVIGKKPIHLIEEKERQKVAKIEEQWIDIGATSREEALKKVNVGDPITFDVGFQPLLGNRVAGKGFDDKVGTFVVAEVLRKVNKEKLRCALYGVSTVQEELGLRGARTSAFGIAPHIGIAIDVTFASDCPDIDKRRVGEISLGKGPVIARGPNINPKVFKKLVEIAQTHQIPYQIQAESRATGTDANAIQITREGVVTGLLGIPNRYMHTPAEIIDLADLDNTIKLLVLFLESIEGHEEWIP
ncbi:MAG: M42 family metallopeptidase, partial [Candidatus Atribacteria bacterium]|nr:M42 family metallopeptidase [Candidatus Atribacteria bacterium]